MKTLKTSLSNKDVLSISDLSTKEINAILELASKLKREHNRARTRPPLRGKMLGMIFQKPSTRTRVSFEVGMFQLGGGSIYLGANDIQLSRGETIEDTAKTLSLYLDCIMARVYSHNDVQTLARYASVPVINGLSDLFHPCQVLADLMTIREQKKKLCGLQLAWLGDGDNVCNDLMIGCAKTGINMAAACPKGYEPPKDVLEIAQAEGKKAGVNITITEDVGSAVKDADIIATDTFISIGKEAEHKTRESIFLPKYQVNIDIMKLAKSDVIFMHCLPAKRGMEVTADVIDGKWSVVWQEAENRLHTQKALLCLLMNATL